MVSELKGWLDVARPDIALVDVREPWEADICSLPQAQLIPMHEIPARYSEIDPDKHIVLYCHHGIRSQQVALFLKQAGFDRLYNLRGGIDAWARQIDPRMATY